MATTGKSYKKSTASSNSQRNILIAVGAIAAALAIAFAFISFRDKNETFKLDDPRYGAYAGIPLDDSVDSNREIEQADGVADGVVQGILEDGTPFIGSLDAPIVFAEFADFSCPHCADFAPEVDLLIRSYVRTGKMRLEFRAVTFVGAQYSDVAARAAYCAAEQGAFWEFHSELFRIQTTRGYQTFIPAEMKDAANEMGLDGDALQSCMNSNRPDKMLASSEQVRAQYGVSATPSLIYRGNNETTWNRFFDSNGEPISRPSPAELNALIESYNEEAAG